MSVGNATQYTITGLQEFSAYILTITASIGVGSSPPASVLVNTSSAGELDDLVTRSGVDLGGRGEGHQGHLPPSPSVHLLLFALLSVYSDKDLPSRAIGRIVFH